MESEIPADVLEAARKVWRDIDDPAVVFGQVTCTQAIELIARAILDERQRCAEIVEGYAHEWDLSPSGSAALRAVARAIEGKKGS